MAKRKSKVLSVILDILAFIFAIFVTGLTFLLYPLWLGFLGLFCLTLMILGFFIDEDELPEFPRKIYNFMGGVCVLSCIVFVLGMYNTHDKLWMYVTYSKEINSIHLVHSIAAYGFMLYRVSIHADNKKQEMKEKEKNEKQNNYRQNYRR